MKERGGQESMGLLDCRAGLTPGKREKNVINEKWVWEVVGGWGG